MFLSLDRLWMKWCNYVCWAHHLFILSCVSDNNVGLPPVSVRDGVKSPTSTSERTDIVYERQRRQQSATGRRATATKRVASAPIPQLNRHLISLDRTAVAEERNWACLGVRQPWYHDSESSTAKFYGVRLRFSRWRFSKKNRQCVIVAFTLKRLGQQTKNTLVFIFRKY